MCVHAVVSDEEMMMICPDCSKLIPLNSPEGLNAVHKAVEKFNHNETNSQLYILQEIGRIKLGVKECDTQTSVFLY